MKKIFYQSHWKFHKKWPNGQSRKKTPEKRKNVSFEDRKIDLLPKIEYIDLNIDFLPIYSKFRFSLQNKINTKFPPNMERNEVDGGTFSWWRIIFHLRRTKTWIFRTIVVIIRVLSSNNKSKFHITSTYNTKSHNFLAMTRKKFNKMSQSYKIISIDMLESGTFS